MKTFHFVRVLALYAYLLCSSMFAELIDARPDLDQFEDIELGDQSNILMESRRGLAVRPDCDVDASPFNGDLVLANLDGPAFLDIESLDCSSVVFPSANSLSLPANLGRLTKLTSLRFNAVGLIGDIPIEIRQLTRLTRLDLGFNFITGNVDHLTFLTNLQSLEANNNLLTGRIPIAFGKLTQLSSLDLSQNSLTGPLDSNIGTFLTALTGLFLDSNSFNGPIPDSFGRLTQMKSLDLSNNEFSSSIPVSFGQMISLEGVSLNDNNFDGPWPEFILPLSGLALSSVAVGNNDFLVRCDKVFLEEYDQISLNTEIINPETVTCSPLNVYGQAALNPEVLRIVDQAPGTFATVSVLDISARDMMIGWTFFKQRDISFNPIEFTPLAALLTFQGFNVYADQTFMNDCKAFQNPSLGFISPPASYSLAYEITIESDETGTTRICFLEMHLTLLPGNGNVEGDILNVVMPSLKPATNYRVEVRPIYVFFPTNRFEFARLVFGIKSSTVEVRTLDDLPESAPLNFISTAGTFSEITLSWDEPDTSTANGDISLYQIECLGLGCPTSILTTDKRQIVIKELNSDTEYSFRVRAKTGADGFSNLFASHVSQTCPDNMKREGPINVDNGCVAVRNNFQISSSESFNCEIAVGTDVLVPNACDVDGVTVTDLDLKQGFWRPSVKDFQGIKRCPIPGFCKKDQVNITSNSNGTVGRILQEPDDQSVELEARQCTDNHRGVYCFSCDDGYALSLIEGCVDCASAKEGEQLTNLYIFIAFIFAVCLLCVVYVVYRTKTDSSTHKQSRYRKYASRVWRIIATKVRILESFLQVLFGFKVILYLGSESKLVSATFEAISNLNLGLLAYAFNFNCVVGLNHYSVLLIYTACPILIMLMIWFAYKMFTSRYKSWKTEMQQEAFNMFFIISFLAYPGASKVIFDTFYCEEFPTVSEETDFIYKSALQSDYRISCEITPERIGWLVYAVIMVVLYPIGILAIYSYFLRKYNQSTGEKHEKYTYLVTELIVPYKKEFFWFEAYELVRKLIQTSFLSFVTTLSDNSQVPSVLALNISLVAFGVLISFSPYKVRSDFVFAVTSLWLLVVSTQLDSWFNTRDCDLSCRENRIGDTLAYLVIGDVIVMILLIIYDIAVETCFPIDDYDEDDDKHEVDDKKLAGIADQSL